jgi:hypothetical protein
MQATLEDRLQVSPDVIVTELTDSKGAPEAVLLDIGTQKYFSLNATGIRIWRQLEEHGSLADAAADLEQAYGLGSDHAAESVLRLAGALIDAGLVKPTE